MAEFVAGNDRDEVGLSVSVGLEVCCGDGRIGLAGRGETESDGMDSRRVACGELTVGLAVGQAGDKQTAAWKLRGLCVCSLVR